MITLFPWQEPLAQRLELMLRSWPTSIVATGTGSGKTYITAAVLKRQGLIPLVLCPKGVISMWQRTLDLAEVDYFDVLNWEKLKTGKTPWYNDGKWSLPEGCVIIADEVHKGASGEGSQTGKALAMTKYYPVKKILVSATMAASPLSMRHTGFLLDLHNWTEASYKAWLRQNKCWFDRYARYWRAPKGKAGREVMAAINAKIADRLLYMKTEEIPGFPESLIQAKLFDLDARDTAEINDMWNSMSSRMKKSGANELAEVGKTRERLEMLKAPVFLELIQEKLEQDISVVVFLNFREPMAKLVELLAKSGITDVSLIYGGQDTGASTRNRDEAIAKFQSDEHRVCVAMIQAGGVGISMHSVGDKRVRHSLISPSYSASDVKQALGRVHRCNGKNCSQVFVMAANTIEERVYQNVNAKILNIESLNDSDLELL